MNEAAPSSSQDFLRTALRANGAFSAVTGAGMLIADGLVAVLLGHVDAIGWVRLVGLGVFAFGLFGFWVAAKQPIPRGLAMGIFAADVAWVVLSWLALLGSLFSGQGWWTVAIVSDMVLLFAIVEWIGLGRADDEATAA